MITGYILPLHQPMTYYRHTQYTPQANRKIATILSYATTLLKVFSVIML